MEDEGIEKRLGEDFEAEGGEVGIESEDLFDFYFMANSCSGAVDQRNVFLEF